MNPVTATLQEETAFDAPTPTNGHAAGGAVAQAAKMPSPFAPVSKKTAAAAKKGNVSASRTGKAKQISYEFSKPPKGIYVKVHPSSAYHILNLPVFVNETAGTYHYINPSLYESDELPERFRNACKLMDIHTAGLADGTFILWFVYVSASRWCKAANKAVETAKREYVIVSSIKQRQTYSVEPATEPIPEPRWASLPGFDQMLMDAFDSTVHVADDKVVIDYMSGGVAAREDAEDE